MSAKKRFRVRVWRGSDRTSYNETLTRRELDLLRRFGLALGVLDHGDFSPNDLALWTKLRSYGNISILGERIP